MHTDDIKAIDKKKLIHDFRSVCMLVSHVLPLRCLKIQLSTFAYQLSIVKPFKANG